jgi:proteasome lid subunit RPN8/RPN11
MMKMRMYNSYRRRRRARQSPGLRFTPYAWAKLVFLRDLGPSEVGGFGISAADDLLLVEDFRLIRQNSGPVTVSLDDSAVADFFDEQVDRGIAPERFARIWIHTHPGSSAEPSQTDERTFKRSFSGPDWALMCILARGGRSYARLAFRTGPGGELMLPVSVEYQLPFAASDHDTWTAEYERCVTLIDQPLVGARPINEDYGMFEHLFRGLGGPWRQE